MNEKKQWVLEDHLCRDCGGRMLRCVKGNGMTPGGNPIYKCADCGKEKASMSTKDLCWCGFSMRQNMGTTAYQCLPFSILETRPELRNAFLSCGCNPERGEVGIVLEAALREER